MTDSRQQEVWFLTGSQNLYGEETLKQVAEDSRVSRGRPRRPGGPAAGPGGLEADAQEPRRHPGDLPRGQRRAGLRRRHHLDAHLLAGQDVDRRAARASQSRWPTCTPSSTASCPGRSIDMDFMNLNQSAHGDREFGFIGARLRLPRKIVVGHWQDRGSPRRSSAAGRAPPWRWPTPRTLKIARFGGTTCARWPSPRATRSRRRSASAGRSTATASATWWSASPRSPTPTVDALMRAVRGDLRARPAAARRAASAAHSCATPPAIEIGLRAFLEEGGFGAFTTTFEDLHGLKQLPGLACQRLMAEGYGFGGEGRLEDRGAGPRHARSWRPASRAAPPSWRTTPTTSTPASELVLGAHMLEICPSIAAARPSIEVHPLGIGGKDDPGRLVFDAAAGPGRQRLAHRPGRPLPAHRQRGGRASPPEHALPKLPVARARLGPRCPTSRRPPRPGSSPAAPTTPCFARSSARRTSRPSPRWSASSSCASARHRSRRLQEGAALERRRLPAGSVRGNGTAVAGEPEPATRPSISRGEG